MRAITFGKLWVRCRAIAATEPTGLQDFGENSETTASYPTPTAL